MLTIKGFLNVVILTDDEGDSPLRVLDVWKLVNICLPFEQGVDRLWMSVVGGVVQGGPLSIVQSHDICILPQKQYDALETPFSAGEVQRGTFLLIPGLFIRIAFKQQLADIYVIVQGSEMKRGFELIWECVDVSPCISELLDWLKVTVERGMVHGSPSIRVNDINVGVVFEYSVQGLLFLLFAHGR